MTSSIQDAIRPFTGGTLTALLPAAPRHLVTHEGYRSIAIESDCLAALAADAYVTDGDGTLNDVLSRGFSHGFGLDPRPAPRVPADALIFLREI